MTNPVPAMAVNAADAITAMQQQTRYTADEVSAYICSLVDTMARGCDAAADDLLDLIAVLPQDWRHDEGSF
jgi:hypothetical protein